MQVYHNNPINQPQTTTTMTPQPTTPITPKYKINQKLVHKNPKGNDIKDGTILIPKYVGTCEQGIYYFCETSNGDRSFMQFRIYEECLHPVETPKTYRIYKADNTIKFTGTDENSFFNSLESAIEKCDFSKDEKVFEYCMKNHARLWEICVDSRYLNQSNQQPTNQNETMQPQPTQPQTLTVGQTIQCDGYRLVVTDIKEAKQAETQPTQEPENEPTQEPSNEPIKPMSEKPTSPATYAKYCPNVFVAKCDQQHEKGSIIEIETKYGKIHEVIVFNLIHQKNGSFYYSIVRADGYNVQERAKQKAARYEQWANSADKKSTQYYEASNEGRDFLSLGEPIKIGHHSEKRHRALIERNWERMGKSVEMSKKADFHSEKAAYWADKADTINLSMPESLEYFEFKLEQAKKEHEGLKNGTIQRSHSFSLTYAKKAVNELEDKVKTAHKLWA